MYSESKILFLNDTFFESLIFSILIFLFKITAAANTGPAKQPLPTSSTPAILLILYNMIIIFLKFWLFLLSFLNLSKLTFFVRVAALKMLDEMKL